MNILLKTFVYTLPLTLTITGCNSLNTHKNTTVTKPTVAVSDTYPVMPPAKDMIRLKEGQTVTSDNKAVAVTFNKVVADDRCPMDSKCIWAGNATVDLTVADKAGKTENLKLSSGDLRGDLKRKAGVFGQVVSLETVYPTPNSATHKQDLTGHYLIDVKDVPAQ